MTAPFWSVHTRNAIGHEAVDRSVARLRGVGRAACGEHREDQRARHSHGMHGTHGTHGTHGIAGHGGVAGALCPERQVTMESHLRSHQAGSIPDRDQANHDGIGRSRAIRPGSKPALCALRDDLRFTIAPAIIHRAEGTTAGAQLLVRTLTLADRPIDEDGSRVTMHNISHLCSASSLRLTRTSWYAHRGLHLTKMPTIKVQSVFALLWYGLLSVFLACSATPFVERDEPDLHVQRLALSGVVKQREAVEAEAAAAYKQQRWDDCARLLLVKSSLSAADEKPSSLWEVASCYTLGGNQSAALNALDEAVSLGLRDVLAIEDQDLVTLHRNTRWMAICEGIRKNLALYKSSRKEPELRERLLAREQSDQRLRKELLKQTDRARVVRMTEELREFDRSTAVQIAVALRLYGYPTKSAVGRDGSKAAWLLVQHCDQDPWLQKAALQMMRPLIDLDEVDPADYAYLADRIAVAQGAAQRYGTQFDGTKPFPIQNEIDVNVRRFAMGMNSLESYTKQIESSQR